MTGRPLEFEDALLSFDPHDGTFTARLLVPGWQLGDSVLTGFEGRWAVRAGLVMTAVVVHAASVRADEPGAAATAAP